MQELNWNIFRLKFNGRESKAFESLCYLLFCREFDRNTGIFRYKNQTGIETEPITVNGQLLGFQSKFFDHTINKQEITESIAKAKGKNPELKKIQIYLNQEFSESTKTDKKEATTKLAIEEFAQLKGLEIEWRVPSHIEAQLSLDGNNALAQYFFSLETGVIDALEQLDEHSSAILKPIHSQIEFNGSEIKIDRAEILKELRSALTKSSLVIVGGVAGVGKTALIKDFLNTDGADTPLFIFKATEFNVTHINDLFRKYGNVALLDFVNEHEHIGEKYIVIDSAEKLSDLQNQDAFREFLSTLLGHKWKIIFTTRYSYLEDLKFQFVEVYRLTFEVLVIKNLETAELEELSSRYGFVLPLNGRLLELLRNPFYLDEYLQAYSSLEGATTFSDFKNLLWDKQIARSSYRINNSHHKRESCFITIAKRRADTGLFFVTEVSECDEETLKSLAADEIIEHDPRTAGVFITHDIYEEWALDKFVERTFYNSGNYTEFFNSLGASLPIRRAFRNWLSEKLLNNREEVRQLIETSFSSRQIENHWKDEILISVLLSDYSEAFFQMFEGPLLEDDQKILVRVVFLLRIACREINENLLQLLGVSKKDMASLVTVFTRPKGTGWDCVIDFLYKHREQVSTDNIDIFLPLLEDWNATYREGATTRLAGLLGLYYYEQAYQQPVRSHRVLKKREKQLTGIILNASSQVKEELKTIFEGVVASKEKNHRNQFEELVHTALSSATESFEVAKNLPEQVISLANRFWFEDPEEKSDREYRHSRSHDIEAQFCVSSRHHFEYYPASAFQTPVFQLLRFAPRVTMDFVLSFTNRAVECYSKSRFGNELEEIEVVIDDADVIKQYASSRLWNTYRGTQVSTYLLESIHMALEKWLLGYAKTATRLQAEAVCNYLIKGSKSASITAIVASVVMAEPSKLFNIARILFQTKRLFHYDSQRWVLDQSTSSHYSFGSGLNYRHKLHEDERMKTCEDSHRTLSLEKLAFKYQFLKFAEDTDDVFQNRLSALHEIFDKYYAKLPNRSEETEEDKTWRLYLARMDRRKMRPEVEERDGQMLVTLNPEIDPELRKFSEESLKISSEAMRYTSLYLWSQVRFREEPEKYEQYQKYEDDPQLVIKETKDIRNSSSKSTEDPFPRLFNASIPAYTCAILIRDFFDKLSDGDREFCKQVIFEFASVPIALKRYYHQSDDGAEPAILSLPLLMRHFPNDRDDFKSLLLLLLIDDGDTSKFAVRAILKYLWEISFEDAQSLFLGYLYLKPKYDDLRNEMRKEHYREFAFSEVSDESVVERFLEKYGSAIEDIVSNKISYKDIGNLEGLTPRILNRAFELLPLGTPNQIHKDFVSRIFPVFAQSVFEDGEDNIDYTLKHNFFDKLAYFVLKSPKNEIEKCMQPFVDNFGASRHTSELFQRFIWAEDRLNRYEEFWTVWNCFYPKIVEMCKNGSSRYDSESIIHNYLLAWPYWNEDAKEWHTLKDREKLFFQKVARNMGQHPSVLYSLSKLLNDVGSPFLNDGILWISEIIENNGDVLSSQLETNTLYYLENVVRKYVLLNRKLLKTSLQVRSRIVVILDFLVERGSVAGYLVREDVL